LLSSRAARCRILNLEFRGRAAKREITMYQAGPFNPGRDAVTDRTVWWDNNNNTPQTFDVLHADMLAHAKGMELYAQDLYGGTRYGSSLFVSALTASKLAWAA
jgi:hypothetical protein